MTTSPQEAMTRAGPTCASGAAVLTPSEAGPGEEVSLDLGGGGVAARVVWRGPLTGEGGQGAVLTLIDTVGSVGDREHVVLLFKGDDATGCVLYGPEYAFTLQVLDSTTEVAGDTWRQLRELLLDAAVPGVYEPEGLAPGEMAVERATILSFDGQRYSPRPRRP